MSVSARRAPHDATLAEGAKTAQAKNATSVGTDDGNECQICYLVQSKPYTNIAITIAV